MSKNVFSRRKPYENIIVPNPNGLDYDSDDQSQSFFQENLGKKDQQVHSQNVRMQNSSKLIELREFNSNSDSSEPQSNENSPQKKGQNHQQVTHISNSFKNAPILNLNFNDKQKEARSESCFNKLKKMIRCIFCLSETKKPNFRIVHLNGTTVPKLKEKNIVKNSKYNIFTFIPLVLYNQFKQFSNFFYLIITISQFIPQLKVGFVVSYAAPLVFVLVVTIIKEGYDDYQRYQQDKQANSLCYEVAVSHNQNTTAQSIKSSDIKPGHIIRIKTKQRIPADLVILVTSEPNGNVFIKTDQLDGETDWKVRKPIHFTQSSIPFAEGHRLPELKNTSIKFNNPSDKIYEFLGRFESGSEQFEPVNLENTLWANTILETGSVWGLVIHTGRETRIQMNSKPQQQKHGLYESEINKLLILLFVVIAIFSFLLVALNGFTFLWYKQLSRFFILLSFIIPISLRVNVDISKAFFCYWIQKDTSIPGTIAKNQQIPEELGRIGYILSDKTGTLTQNDMQLKRIVIAEEELMTASEADISRIKRSLTQHCTKLKTSPGQCDSDERSKESPQLGSIESISEEIEKKNQRRQKNKSKGEILRDTITAFAVCNNVTPVFDNTSEEYSFQASSPDELALVKFAKEVNMKLQTRDDHIVVIENPNGVIETYQILAQFPFSSESKRMGIIVRHEETNQIIFYLKGADSVMLPILKKIYQVNAQDDCDVLSQEGLRTLIVAQKILTDECYTQWKVVFEEACANLENRREKIEEAISKLEVDLDLLCVTGVEDKLQDDVCGTIESMRQAGIKVWLLTGDKTETAKCVALNSGLQYRNQELFEIRDEIDELMLREKIQKFSKKKDCALLIDGVSLTIILASESLISLFFGAACQAQTVICCRCAPKQKAEVTQIVKRVSKKRILGIGDGGNDVGMIQEAHVGIGIAGKEGNQAALASDFSITEFRFLQTLLFWHGRNSYKRGSTLAYIVIHRGMIITVIQLIFSCIFYYVAVPIYDGLLTLGYSSVYTQFPMLSLVFDSDISKCLVIQYPRFYAILQMNKRLSVKNSLIWVFISVYQGAIIIVLAILLFENSYVDLATITFTALIIIQLLNVYSEIHRFHFYMFLVQLITFLIYAVSLFFLSYVIHISIIDWKFCLKVAYICIATWVPIHSVRVFKSIFQPKEEKIIMQKLFSVPDLVCVIIGNLSFISLTAAFQSFL